jgi:hypothetical protein
MPLRQEVWLALVALAVLRCPLPLRSLLLASLRWALPKSRLVFGVLGALAQGF